MGLKYAMQTAHYWTSSGRDIGLSGSVPLCLQSSVDAPWHRLEVPRHEFEPWTHSSSPLKPNSDVQAQQIPAVITHVSHSVVRHNKTVHRRRHQNSQGPDMTSTQE